MAFSYTAPRVELEDLERERSSLTDEERRAALDDIYGTGAPMEETEELIHDCLEQLSAEVDVIQSKDEYLVALETIPDYVQSRDFRLMFLRADRFDAVRAASRMVQFWRIKVQLFGPELAYREERIRLADLTDDDLATLRNGGWQPLPCKDEAGRALFLLRRKRFRYEKRESVARLFWYSYWLALEEVDIQRNGVVIIMFDDGPISFSDFDRRLDKLLVEMLERGLPIRVQGMHHLFDNRITELILPLLLHTLGRNYRSRYRLYPGRKKGGRIRELGSYGIPEKALPVDMGGTVQVDLYREQWYQQIEQEAYSQDT